MQLTIVDRILRADGLIFVIDSQTERLVADIECLEQLRGLMSSRGHDFDRCAVAFQANKRDLPNVVTMAQLRASFHHPRGAFVESVAKTGAGTVEAVAELIRLHAAH